MTAGATIIQNTTLLENSKKVGPSQELSDYLVSKFKDIL